MPESIRAMEDRFHLVEAMEIEERSSWAGLPVQHGTVGRVLSGLNI